MTTTMLDEDDDNDGDDDDDNNGGSESLFGTIHRIKKNMELKINKLQS